MNIDDPILTAFALDELTEPQRSDVAAIIAADPLLAAEVEHIRIAAGMLREALHADPVMDEAPLVVIAPTRRKRMIYAAAASVACLLIGGAVGYLMANNDRPKSTQVHLPVAQTPIVATTYPNDTVPTVGKFIEIARHLTEERKYDEAIAIVDQILKIDPSNDYAIGIRPLLEDKKRLAALRVQVPSTQPSALNYAEETRIPVADILGYPADWPDLVAGRSKLPAEGAIDINSASQAALNAAGGTQPMVIVPNNAAPTYFGARTSTGVVQTGVNPALVTGLNGPPLNQTRGTMRGAAVPGTFNFQLGTSRVRAFRTSTLSLTGTSTAGPGTNVLFANSDAKWQQTPFAGVNGDNIYTARARTGMAAPANDSDSILALVQEETDKTETRNTSPAFNTEAYDRIRDNPFLDVAQNPLSTFSVDVDSASYANVRRFIQGGQLPPPDAIRIEELVNYFPYDYAAPAKTDEAPFKANVEVSTCPWKTGDQIVRIALKGREIAIHDRPASNLVFLLDVSGSMDEPNKLPLVKESLKKLVNQLDERDKVSIVVYAGASGLALPATNATHKDKILAAIDSLHAEGSTNGAEGIQLAYQLAMENFVPGGTNRVLLMTDGDFNVGVTDRGSLTRLIEEKAKSKVYLSVLGFGMGNLKDATMEELSGKGNGNYAYIDSEKEAQKVLVEQMSGTLLTIAKDVKLQVEFNPRLVKSYRLIGYEDRMLAKEDFNDDRKDAGDIGAGHTVTALYEVEPNSDLAIGALVPDRANDARSVDTLKYQTVPALTNASNAPELATLKLRYKAPDADAVQGTSKLLEISISSGPKPFDQCTPDFRFATSVAGFGMVLRDSPNRGSLTLDEVKKMAQSSLGEDKGGLRAEFLTLVEKAMSEKR